MAIETDGNSFKTAVKEEEEGAACDINLAGKRTGRRCIQFA